MDQKRTGLVLDEPSFVWTTVSISPDQGRGHRQYKGRKDLHLCLSLCRKLSVAGKENRAYRGLSPGPGVQRV